MRIRSPFVFLAALLAPAASAQVGAPFCFGNACPCANDDPSAGCGNAGFDGDPTTGALLTGMGSGDVFLDDLELVVSGLPAGQFGVMVMANGSSAPTPLGDGLLCLGGGLFRFPPRVANSSGVLTEGAILAGAEQISAMVTIGSTWNFQAWHRDPGGPCGGNSNLSNALPVTFQAPGLDAPIETELGGRPLASFPFFERPLVSNEGDDLYVNVDPGRFPQLTGQTVDLFVVAARTSAEWDANDVLVDARGASQAFTIGSGSVSAGTALVSAGGLNGTSGTDLGVPYDLVVDVDRDGLLGPGDLIDGRGDRPGTVVVRDVTQAGPMGVTSSVYSLGSQQNQKLYYPSNVASMGELPVVIVSHGNGHNYQWYDHIGEHMASYGYVVMSHFNNTGPGIETASQTTLVNTDSFLGNLGSIDGGVLVGHVDDEQLVWIGHSRGGEGVTRAYDRLLDADYVPSNYDINGIRLISSIAPTTFFGQLKSNPHGANYHLWVGSADADVSGSVGFTNSKPFTLLERGTGRRAATVLHGVGHGAFHDGGGSTVATGPCQVNRPTTHVIMRGYLLPMISFYVRGEVAGEDFFWRQWEGFGPSGKPTSSCIAVNLEYIQAESERLVVDSFQENPAVDLSSSGGTVSTDLTSLVEGRFRDLDASLNYTPSDPFNGMTRAGGTLDQPLGYVIAWDDPRFLEFDLAGGEWDVRDYEYLSFRATQISHHPLTVADLGDVNFDVSLIDRWGNESTIRVGVYGGGVEEPYQRSGGWSNEFEVQRFPLRDFLADGQSLDLSRLSSVRLTFAGGGASSEGAIGFDDLEFTQL